MLKLLTTDSVKIHFGKFSYSEIEGGRIRIDPVWVNENIISVTIPQLAELTPSHGRIRFHKKAASQLVNAFSEIERKGLCKYLVTWNGSFVPRHICWDSRKGLSRHSWGTAFDINVQWNGYGKDPAAENKYGTVMPLVPIFESHGFAWGGLWRTPDGMHFEVAVIDPVTQYVNLIVNDEPVKDAEVIIRSNSRSYGLLGPIAVALGIQDDAVTSNQDTVPVAAFLKSHGYRIKWVENEGPKGTIFASGH